MVEKIGMKKVDAYSWRQVPLDRDLARRLKQAQRILLFYAEKIGYRPTDASRRRIAQLLLTFKPIDLKRAIMGYFMARRRDEDYKRSPSSFFGPKGYYRQYLSPELQEVLRTREDITAKSRKTSPYSRYDFAEDVISDETVPQFVERTEETNG